MTRCNGALDLAKRRGAEIGKMEHPEQPSIRDLPVREQRSLQRDNDATG